MRRKVWEKQEGRQELDENRQKACGNNKQNWVPGDPQCSGLALGVNFPGGAPAKSFFQGKSQQIELGLEVASY